jgi:hypothetical protein
VCNPVLALLHHALILSTLPDFLHLQIRRACNAALDLLGSRDAPSPPTQWTIPAVWALAQALNNVSKVLSGSWQQALDLPIELERLHSLVASVPHAAVVEHQLESSEVEADSEACWRTVIIALETAASAIQALFTEAAFHLDQKPLINGPLSAVQLKQLAKNYDTIRPIWDAFGSAATSVTTTGINQARDDVSLLVELAEALQRILSSLASWSVLDSTRLPASKLTSAHNAGETPASELARLIAGMSQVIGIEPTVKGTGLQFHASLSRVAVARRCHCHCHFVFIIFAVATLPRELRIVAFFTEKSCRLFVDFMKNTLGKVTPEPQACAAEACAASSSTSTETGTATAGGAGAGAPSASHASTSGTGRQPEDVRTIVVTAVQSVISQLGAILNDKDQTLDSLQSQDLRAMHSRFAVFLRLLGVAVETLFRACCQHVTVDHDSSPMLTGGRLLGLKGENLLRDLQAISECLSRPDLAGSDEAADTGTTTRSFNAEGQLMERRQRLNDAVSLLQYREHLDAALNTLIQLNLVDEADEMTNVLRRTHADIADLVHELLVPA